MNQHAAGTSALSPSLRDHIGRYAASHQAPVNKALHFFGIPLLVVASLGLLARVAPFESEGVVALRPNAAWVVLLGAGLWYAWQDWRLGLVPGVLQLGCYALGCALPVPVLAALFAVGMLAHLLGHYGFEGKPPALFLRPVALLEAPAWLLAAWAGLLPGKRG